MSYHKFTSYSGKGIEAGSRSGEHLKLKTLVKIAEKTEDKKLYVSMGYNDLSGRGRSGQDKYIINADGTYSVEKLDAWGGGKQYLRE